MAVNGALVVALLPLAVWYLYSLAAKWRFRERDGLSYAPRSLLFGTGKLVGDMYRKGDLRRHIDYILYDIAKSMDYPPVYIADFRPFFRPTAVICSHHVAEQISKASKMFPYSTPKAPTTPDIRPVVGEHSIVTTENEEWKSIRKTYNPGFSPAHLNTLLPRMLEKFKPFIGHLDRIARSGEPSTLGELCVNLTFDIIGSVTMDVDLGAQLPEEQQSALVRYYRDLVHSYTDNGGVTGVPMNPFRAWRRKNLTRNITRELTAIVNKTFANIKNGADESSQKKDRSVLALSLQGLNSLSPQDLTVISGTLKAFLFAGHDTTSILIQWAFYELSRSPRVLETLRSEIDTVFGADADSDAIFAALASTKGSDYIKNLPYTSAIIKETLRLHPPASTGRLVPDNTGFFVQLPDGKSVCLDGFILYNNHFLVQRDPRVYGETADDFVPERWFGDSDTSRVDDIPEAPNVAVEGRVPPGAWRPYERGPRNCIGQELANIEVKMVLAIAARRYDFVKVGAGAPKLDEKGSPIRNALGQYEVETPLFNTRQVTAKPFDGMRMKVNFRENRTKFRARDFRTR